MTVRRQSSPCLAAGICAAGVVRGGKLVGKPGDGVYVVRDKSPLVAPRGAQ